MRTSSPRSAAAALIRAVVCCSMNDACAADPGDAHKSATDAAAIVTVEASVELHDSGAAANVPDSSGEDTATDDASTGVDVFEGSPDSAVEDATQDATPVEAGARPPSDAACDLQSIPASCPNCATQNASDMPKCQQYLQCFEQNACDPSGACGSNDGVCGVNTVGGGEAPYQAAVQTYDCACP